MRWSGAGRVARIEQHGQWHQRHTAPAISTADVPVAQAWFWDVSQAQFLAKALADDSDWSNAVDTLSSRLVLG